MNDRTILVTGGAGFIGSHVVDKLVEANNKVIVIDNLISSSTTYLELHIQSKLITFIKGDIRDTSVFKNIDESLDYIYHFAADPNVRESVLAPLNSFDHNMQGTINILEFARRKQVKGFIFASSGGTLYGDVESFPIKESDLLKPISPYGASKAACEMYVSAYAYSYNFKAVSLRYANIFGERSNHGVTYEFFHRLKENPNELEILGDGQQKKSYLHVSDCVEASLVIADNLNTQSKKYDYFNVGSEDWITVNDLAELLEKIMGLSNVMHTFTGGQKGWVGDVHLLLLSIQKLKALGWKPKLTFEDGLRKYVNWMESVQ
ncbi:MAG: NAD-dependent epimerase/dehydratase family protein [Candidatus Lokiarchaeota archaeon]|nr:NAD-dependent epimerase/dehydratase family protein [Candidatus Lokiarchaeota archaeon]